MCYSAKVWADYRKYTKMFGAELSIHEFINLFQRRSTDARVVIPKGM